MAGRRLRIRSTTDGTTTTVSLTGELDVGAERQFLDFFARVPAGPALAIDLSEVTFIDSRGVNALIRTVGARRAAGTPTLVVGAAPQGLRLFELTGLKDRLMGDATGQCSTDM